MIQMRRPLKLMAWFAFLGLIAIVGYEAVAVIKARRVTPRIFENILADKNETILFRDIPPKRIEQLLAIEDPNFYKHNGVDLSTPGAGLTTITQGIVKYLYFDQFQPGFMKVEQTLIAWLAVTPLISKEDQLTAFINTAYLGHVDGTEVKGFAAAARIYYGKSFDELTEDEYLSLVAMLISPNGFSVKSHGDQNRIRVERIKKVLSGIYQPNRNLDVYYDEA